MKAPTHKIEEVCSDEDARLSMNYVHFNKEKNRLEASNGKALAVVPVKDADDDVTGFIPADAIRLARRPKKAIGILHANGEVRVPTRDGIQKYDAPRDEDGSELMFPDIDPVVPKHKGRPTVRLDAELLLKLAKAICADGRKDLWVSLWVDGERGVYVEAYTPSQREGAYGVIMPLTKPKELE